MRTAIFVAGLLTLTPHGALVAWQAPAPPAATPAPASQTAGPATATENKPAAVVPRIDPKAYVIGPEDVISVNVWREPANSGQFVVRPDGRIAIPLVGEIQAAGLTPERLSAAIAEGLQKVMTHPEVTVGVERVNSKKYFIQGEINRPGAYSLAVPTSVLEALVNAGGFRDFANTKKIIVLRGSQRLKFNYHDVSKGKNMEQNIPLLPGDQIIVP
jgi:polysaccharide biosynthesis/export protein